MTATSVQSLVEGLAREDRANLACILETKSEDAVSICERVRWLYWSKIRAGIMTRGSVLADTVLSKTIGKLVQPVTGEDYLSLAWMR